MRSVDRPLPGDMLYRRKSQAQPALAKKKSAYYENEFAATRESNPAMDRVRNEAIVMAELKTNCIVSAPSRLPVCAEQLAMPSKVCWVPS